MLIRSSDLERIVTGEVTLAFRRWRRPTVRTGGTLTTAAGVLAIDDVTRVDESAISSVDARRAGYTSRAELLDTLARHGSGDVYRIALHFRGADPRIALRDERPDSVALEALCRRLSRLDHASTAGPWTSRTLRLLRDHPDTRAADLAPCLDLSRDAFKRNVRKLKNLGLTESLEVGYRLAPRGRAVLAHLEQEKPG